MAYEYIWPWTFYAKVNVISAPRSKRTASLTMPMTTQGCKGGRRSQEQVQGVGCSGVTNNVEDIDIDVR